MCFEVISMLSTVVGTVAGMQAANAQAQAQQNQYNYAAQVEENNAGIARAQASNASDQGAIEEQQIRRRNLALAGAQKAGLAASGLDIASGDPLKILADTGYIGELDAQTSRYNTAQKVWGLNNQATDYLAQGQMYKTAGENAIAAGKANATATLLTGVGSLASQYSVFAGSKKTTVSKKVGGNYGADGR